MQARQSMQAARPFRCTVSTDSAGSAPTAPRSSTHAMQLRASRNTSRVASCSSPCARQLGHSIVVIIGAPPTPHHTTRLRSVHAYQHPADRISCAAATPVCMAPRPRAERSSTSARTLQTQRGQLAEGRHLQVLPIRGARHMKSARLCVINAAWAPRTPIIALSFSDSVVSSLNFASGAILDSLLPDRSARADAHILRLPARRSMSHMICHRHSHRHRRRRRHRHSV
jgi:hypothetical protein